MYLALNVDKLVKICVFLVWIFVHKLLKSLTFYKVHCNSPFAVDNGNLVKNRHLYKGIAKCCFNSCVCKSTQVYDGMRDILWDYVHAGGTICVVSHSLSPNILRDYRENKLPEPKLVYGWEVPKDRRKPQPHALYDIMEKLGFTAEQMLVLDDLKPGYDMAKAANVRFAAAGWSNDIPEIEAFMRQNCDLYFKTVEAFGDYLLHGKEA